MQYSNSTTLYGLVEDISFLAHSNIQSISALDLKRIINKYYLQLQEVVRAVNENFYQVSATSDLVIGDGSYSFPDGTGTAPAYEKIKSIWVAFQPVDKTTPLANEYRRVDIIDPDSISNPAYTFSPDSPKAMIFGKYFVLLPLVTDVTKFPVTDGVKMYYIGEQVLLSADTDVPNIFPTFHDAITEGALIDVLYRLGDEVGSKEYEAKFERRLEEIKAYASSRIPPEMGLVEGQDDLGGWAFPFGNQSMS